MNKQTTLVFLFLAVTGFIVFYPGLKVGFVADDFVWLEKCRHLSEFNVLDTKSFAFTKSRPGTLFIFALLFKLFGLNSLGFHAVAGFFHVLNAFLLFVTLLWFRVEFEFGFLVSLFFLVHFANEENVFWVASLSNIFCLFFSFCAVLSYMQWLQGGKTAHKVLVTFCTVLALSMREDGLTIPLYLFFIGYLSSTNQIRGFSGFRGLFKQNLVFLIPSLIFLLLRLSSAVKEPGPYVFTLNPLIWIKNLAYFVLNLILPIRYFFDQLGYEWHERLRHLFLAPNRVIVVGMVSIVIFVLLWLSKRRLNIAIPNTLKAGVVLSGIGLLPYLSLDGNSPRFLYFSLIGGVIVIVSFIFLAAEKISKPTARRMVNTFATVFALISSVVLWERGQRWVASSLTARSIVEETRMVVLNDLAAGEKIYVANLPFSRNGAYIFNPGNFQPALTLTAPEIVNRVQDIGNKNQDELRDYKDRRVFTFQNGKMVEFKVP